MTIDRISYAEYAQWDAVNFSTMKYMDKSPRHYRHAVDVGREDNTSLLKGRAAHTAVFEPDEFGRKYAVYKATKQRKGKKWEAFKAAHDGDSILKIDEYEQALLIRDAVRKDEVAGPLLVRGHAEQSITWTDPLTGLRCKARIDWFNELCLADLKGVSTTDARIFGALAARMKYHTQMAWYSDGLMLSHGVRPPVKLIAVEVGKEHDVAVFTLSDEDLFAGTETYQRWLKRIAECRESGVWPGRYTEEQSLSLPKYVFEDENQEDGSSMIITDEEDAV
jgi:hypothetical protein